MEGTKRTAGGKKRREKKHLVMSQGLSHLVAPAGTGAPRAPFNLANFFVPIVDEVKDKEESIPKTLVGCSSCPRKRLTGQPAGPAGRAGPAAGELWIQRNMALFVVLIVFGAVVVSVAIVLGVRYARATRA